MAEHKYKYAKSDLTEVTEAKLRVIKGKSARSDSDFLEPTDIPLNYNTVKKPLKLSYLRTAWRLINIVFVAVMFIAGMMVHFVVFWKHTLRVEKNAKLFAWLFKLLGGAFTKIGQQMSLRRDILPPVYCDELNELLDNAKAFSFDYTVKEIEKLTGRKMEELFSEFHEEPIGKASIACVYKARLRNGDTVAVKVKRPGIERIFSADIAALSFVLKLMESLTIMSSGFSANLRHEIREMFTEELNFNVERRYQELFGEFMKKNKRFHVEVPKLYFGLSSDNVIVSEFLQGGIFMSDFTKLSQEHQADKLKELNINPKKVSKRLIHLNHFSFYELPFFHGDPHPGNVYLRPNNQIVMVDFGSCGSFGSKEKNLMQLMQYYYSKQDVSGMTQCVVRLMEPLPPIDVHAFTKELESEWWHGYYGIISKHAHWTEKTSFRLWSALFSISRKYNVPVPLHMLRMVRATLAYDTVAAGLYPGLNVFKEYQVYFNRYAQKVKNQTLEEMLRQFLFGPDAINFVRLRRVMDLGDEALFRMQQLISLPIPNFNSMTDKVFDFIRLFFEYLIRVAVIVGTGAILMTQNADVGNDWDEIHKVAFSPENLLEIGSDNFLDMEELNEAFSKEMGTETAKIHTAKIMSKVGFIRMLLMTEIFLVGFLTILYLRKILLRFADLDART